MTEPQNKAVQMNAAPFSVFVGATEYWPGDLERTPAAFCTWLFDEEAMYCLRDDVDKHLWRIALEHFARTRVSTTQFERLLRLRAAGQLRPRSRPASVDDPGARVAARLLSAWYDVRRRPERRRVAGPVVAPSPSGTADTLCKTCGEPVKHEPGLNEPVDDGLECFACEFERERREERERLLHQGSSGTWWTGEVVYEGGFYELFDSDYPH